METGDPFENCPLSPSPSLSPYLVLIGAWLGAICSQKYTRFKWFLRNWKFSRFFCLNQNFPSQNVSFPKLKIYLPECLLSPWMPFIPSVEFFIIKSIGINIAKLNTNSFIYSIKSLLVLRISKFDILNYYRVFSCDYLLYWHVHITLFNLDQGIMKMCFWPFVPLYIIFVRDFVFHHIF